MRKTIAAIAIAIPLLLVGWWILAPRSEEPKSVPPREPSRLEQLGLPADTLVDIKRLRSIEDLPTEIAQFETVFWYPADTVSLRKLIRETSLVEGKDVLEIGTGTGLVALCCLLADARKVVATDVNPSAIANAAYNADRLHVAERLETRLVSLDRLGAFSVVDEAERFDLIISNPPWEDRPPAKIVDYAFDDENFALLKSLLKGLTSHLEPGGKALLAYGCVTAIKTLLRIAPDYDLEVRILDDRKLDDLSESFLPGMLLEVTPKRE